MRVINRTSHLRLSRREFLQLSAMAGAGTMLTSAAFQRRQRSVEKYGEEQATWLEKSIIYGVVPRLFGPRGFADVTEKLAYLQDLGVNALWLSPVTATRPRDFGYSVTDYFELRPDYGTKQDFRDMVQEAHARGIRVLMDFVPNHTSSEHPYFQDAQARGKDSPYYHFYDRDRDGNYTYYFHWTHLPNVNLDYPRAAQWMLDALSYWVREFDVDGYRVDVAWGIRQRNPEIWSRWNAELKKIKPDLLMLAEASARDPYYFDNGFDAAYDWTDQLGHWAWERVFENSSTLTEKLHAALTNSGKGYHPDALIFRFLNNNDTGPRFITRHGLEMTRIAAALLLTLPGIPCIYTGQEVGAEYEPYRQREPISWEDRHGLRDYYKKLIALRKSRGDLHSRRWTPLEIEPAESVYGYLRYLMPGNGPTVVLLNFSSQPVEATVHLPEDVQDQDQHAHTLQVQDGQLLDLLEEQKIDVEMLGATTLRVPMKPWSVRILAES